LNISLRATFDAFAYAGRFLESLQSIVYV
jgi:hypothetical protein